MVAPLPLRECWVLVQLVGKLLIPSIDGSSPVLDGVTNMMVPSTGPAVGAPHVSNLGALGSDNFTSADPHAHTLVYIFTAPSKHVWIVTTALLPPPVGHAKQTSREHAHVHVICTSPFEVSIPSYIALGASTTAIAYLCPSINVQSCDRRDYHPSVILCDQAQDVDVPILLRSHMTVQEDKYVTSCAIATGFLCSDQTDSLLMPEYLHLELLLDLWSEVCL
mmetsp:Transcript_72514/g.172899  ORF Transcript_72514/g.172899 Transcript_72514/m.172899 type:complete len:221 (-) Transcript_72514:726-1388(-)